MKKTVLCVSAVLTFFTLWMGSFIKPSPQRASW